MGSLAYIPLPGKLPASMRYDEHGLVQRVKPPTAADYRRAFVKRETDRLNKVLSIASEPHLTPEQVQAIFDSVNWQCEDTGQSGDVLIVFVRPLLLAGARRRNLRVVHRSQRWQYPKRRVSRWAA